MKRLSLLALLPLVLFALERVNLIRNSSFEKDDSVWVIEKGAYQEPNPAEGTTQDNSKSVEGIYSASSDTREEPSWVESFEGDSVTIRQPFVVAKKMADLDSLIWQQAIHPLINSYYSRYCLIGFTYANPERNGFGYGFINPDYAGVDDWLDVSESITDDTLWQFYNKSLHSDFGGVDPGQELASFVLLNWGIWFGTQQWRGQKTYWDDIRLMGYADYDVGVKEILSGDSLEVGTPYQPVARIKNFGRENADSFLVMAEIWNGASIIYVDTLPWSLEGDTEDTVTFADFDPPTTGSYTLTVRTHMEPDECDEDDEVSKEIGHTAIVENPLPEGLSLEVIGMSRGVLKVSFETPNGQVANLSVYDVTGRRIERMAVTRSGSVTFNSALASGVYLVRLESNNLQITRKAVVLR